MREKGKEGEERRKGRRNKKRNKHTSFLNATISFLSQFLLLASSPGSLLKNVGRREPGNEVILLPPFFSSSFSLLPLLTIQASQHFPAWGLSWAYMQLAATVTTLCISRWMYPPPPLSLLLKSPLIFFLFPSLLLFPPLSFTLCTLAQMTTKPA